MPVTFDRKAQAELDKAAQRAEYEREYADLSVEQIAENYYELGKSAEESERRRQFLKDMLTTYALNLGEYKFEIADTYRVTLSERSRKTLSADLLFANGVASEVIEASHHTSKFSVLEVRKI